MKQLLTKENFECDKYCGECCKKLAIKLTKSDIYSIKNLGYKEEDFIDKTLSKLGVLFIKNENSCFFLKKHLSGKFSCKIYEIRPKTCKDYPFFNKKRIKSCLPRDLYPTLLQPKVK
ncbi:hypothetical protein CMO93_01195 [Candidatus Woesearchaeota archaeon]|nr:hypothetical protein [Candidatus Woesearchaeota archaeon]|tara:strand:+ start:920 stop:1270 length:351 start_codon:yes stop_codon:yes gene_type:complete